MKMIKIPLYILIFIILIILVTKVFLFIFTKPSNERDWSLDQDRLASAVIPTGESGENKVFVKNIRNFNYRSTIDYDREYYDREFDLDNLNRVWYLVSPFSGIPGSAHTFLSFEFEDSDGKKDFLSVSVEIRKEKEEAFHPIKGLFNQYEVMYVLGDENDLVKLRTNHRKDLVYAYPAKASPEKARALLLDILRRTNELAENPEFYNTITNTCTTNIADHINTVTPKTIPFLSWRIMFPANSDQLAYDLGLLDVPEGLSIEELRQKYLLNEKAVEFDEIQGTDFSQLIRLQN
jgi:hypothetical protein